MQTGRQRCFECLKSLLDLALHVQAHRHLDQVKHGSPPAGPRLTTIAPELPGGLEAIAGLFDG